MTTTHVHPALEKVTPQYRPDPRLMDNSQADQGALEKDRAAAREYLKELDQTAGTDR